MDLNVYKNLYTKVKYLLHSERDLTVDEKKLFQWQLHASLGDAEPAFVIGKGGANTIFYSLSQGERKLCYPNDALDLLDNISKRKEFVYVALDKAKVKIGYFLLEAEALDCKNARYVASVSFKGKTTTLWKKQKDLFGKKQWEPT